MRFPFLSLAARSPSRQRTFRRVVALHLLVLGSGAWATAQQSDPIHSSAFLGHLLLVLGIVEGAVMVGWRLTQLPKSQALEFLLVSPLRPERVFRAEALVGVAWLALVTLSGLPLLGLLSLGGRLDALDIAPLLVMPFTWGAAAGLGLTVWAYEALTTRRWTERGAIALVVVYLVVGVLAGENLKRWLDELPAAWGQAILYGVVAVHRYNPFAVMGYWFENEPLAAWERVAGFQLVAVAAVLLLLVRGAIRLKAHFHELHYRPAVDRSGAARRSIGKRPLSWWAVRRVTHYSGRINLWLAGGFSVLYALYTVTEPLWPAWLGRRVFLMCDQAGGPSMLATGLVVLAAVPAAFQYGLWDASAHDRCRRLELLLLTDLEARDYWEAAAAAAWRRGRGYFSLAALLWAAAVLSGQATVMQAVAAAGAGVLLWGLYFALGFRAFARGLQAGALGMVLTLGLPLAAGALAHAGWPGLAALVPPGSVYSAGTRAASAALLPGPLFAAGAALIVTRRALARCDRDLRAWYERHHGQKLQED